MPAPWGTIMQVAEPDWVGPKSAPARESIAHAYPSIPTSRVPQDDAKLKRPIAPDMEPTENLLLVTNQEEAGKEIKALLRRHDMLVDLRKVSTLREFKSEVEVGPVDIALIHYGIPACKVQDSLAWLRDQAIPLPFIVLSSQRDEAAIVECIRMGADDFIVEQNISRLPSAVRNTLARHRAEKARANTEAQYRLITESTQDLIALLDRKHQIVYASPSFRRVLEHNPATLEGIPFLSLVHPEDLPALEQGLEESLFFCESRNVELRLCQANGSWVDVESSLHHITDDQGHPEQALVVSRDVSDRKRAEREIRKLAAFARYNPNPVLEFGADGGLTYFNDAAMRVARGLKRPHPQMILPLNTGTIVKRCLSTGKSQEHLETNLEGRWIRWSFFPVAGNRVVHCYAEEITDSRNLEASLRQAQKMESIGQLAAGVAHDFNNILTVIQGYADLMQTLPDLGELPCQSAREIALAATRASSLTRQLLLFSRKQILQPQLLNLNDVIGNVNKMLSSMLGERIQLKKELADTLPGVHADPGMLEQILVNLVVNARDAIERNGTITLRTDVVKIDAAHVREHKESSVGSFVCLSVTDTGHGMDEATRNRIFEPFFTTKQVGQGTGLGLATVYGIARQHEGWLEVESQPQRGTIFKLYLPVSTKAPELVDPMKRLPAPGGHETILLVEDESCLRELVQEILIKKGYRVLDAPNGVAALEIWQRHKDEIALVFTDMMMPEGVSGRDLANRILAERADLKILFTSGYSLDSVDPDFNSHQMRNFLQKPYNPETLAKAVRECLNGPGTN